MATGDNQHLAAGIGGLDTEGFPVAATVLSDDESMERDARSKGDSASPKRVKREPEATAEDQLAILLAQQASKPAQTTTAVGGEVVPAWAAALQSSFQSNFAEVKELMSDYGTRILALEAKSSTSNSDPRVDDLAAKVEALTRLVQGSQALDMRHLTTRILGQDTLPGSLRRPMVPNHLLSQWPARLRDRLLARSLPLIRIMIT